MTEKEIKQAYLKPPSVPEILSFIDELGISYAHFEFYYGIPSGTIKNVKAGFRNLQVRFWPIIYERTVPQYGVLNDFKKPDKKAVAKKVAHSQEQIDADASFSHPRLTLVKNK